MLRPTFLVGFIALSLLVVGCGPMDESEDDIASAQEALETDNGFTLNGLTMNGLTMNGLTMNGLTMNGLTMNGLSTLSFHDWFDVNALQGAPMVMKYLVRCALSADKTLTYTASTGITYAWQGLLNLAPTWTAGKPIPVREQQVMSACLAAHVNKFGRNVTISLRGHKTSPGLLPVSLSEKQAYTAHEGCFFGNLFNGEGVFSAYAEDGPLLLATRTSVRACVMSGGTLPDCSPMEATGVACEDICTYKENEYNDLYTFQTCTWNGVAYSALSTNISPNDIAVCGNGACELSESCFSAASSQGCQSDCGACL